MGRNESSVWAYTLISLPLHGESANCGAKLADTPCVIYLEVAGVCSEWKD